VPDVPSILFSFDFLAVFRYFRTGIHAILERSIIMKSIKSIILVLTAALILHSAVALNMAQADEIIVNNSPTASCSSTATPPCYTTIQAAIDAAVTLNLNSATTGTIYSVRVEPGSYAEYLTLKGITVQGRETARTILSGGGSGTLVSANTSSTGSISNITFSSASIGIDASNNTASFEIRNNIFREITTAVKLQGSSNTTISNNVFYLNGTAISTNEDRVIKNNIFSNNTMAISTTATTVSNITYNDFFSNTSDGVVWDTVTNITKDPLFVDATASNPDFHLKSGSPCINKGNATDMGAYGGSGTDTIPFLVSGVTSSLDTTTNIISVSWNANNSYLVTGYRVYYGATSGDHNGTGATEGASPISVTAATTTSATLSGLISSVTATPANPTLNSVSPLNESLDVSWSAVDGATGYRIYYGTSSPPSTTVDVGDATTYTLSGLTNGQTYFVAVSAIAQPTYYIAVTAIDSTGPYDPGIEHESAYSLESSVSVGSPMESGLSNIINDFPEALVAYPNLTSQGPSEHCFIATAAFGYYSAPEVQALREFRDRYLLTTSAGSAFVRWYYEHGPVAAAYLDAHPAYKPVVRAALMPAVGAALFMTRTSFFIKTVVTLFILTIALTMAYRSSRKKLSGSGGSL